ncbi:MAG: YceI family protein [Bacteroidetes bacterium]|nr:YceI family protein [Bacteroidota bacterium]
MLTTIILSLPLLLNPTLRQAGTLTIESNSRLYLEGTSNVTDFDCVCEQDLSDLHYEFIRESGKLSFHNTDLYIQSNSLDCGHNGMNRDMYQTLKADQYPSIRIELLNVYAPPPDFNNCVETKDIHVRLAHTIAGKRQVMTIPVQAENRGNHRYRFRSSYPVILSDFGLKMPSPMLGLVKVSDTITIHIDLWVSR